MLNWKQNPFLVIPFIGAFLILLISLFSAIRLLPSGSNISLITRFGVLSGIHSFGSIGSVLITLLIAFLYFFVSALSAWFIYVRRPHAAYLLSASALFFSLLILIYIGVIIGIN